MHQLLFIIFMFLPNFLLADSTSQSKSDEPAVRQRSKKACPAGIGPMNKTLCPRERHQEILKILGSETAANCYSRLFVAETSSCAPGTYHDKKKAFNPYEGFGLCAIEKSREIRKQNRRGPNCLAKDIGTSFERQVLCCRDIVNRWGKAYMGTVKCGKAPDCQGMSRGVSPAEAVVGCKIGQEIKKGSDCEENPRARFVCKINGRYKRRSAKKCKDKPKASLGCEANGKIYFINAPQCKGNSSFVFLCKNDQEKYTRCPVQFR